MRCGEFCTIDEEDWNGGSLFSETSGFHAEPTPVISSEWQSRGCAVGSKQSRLRAQAWETEAHRDGGELSLSDCVEMTKETRCEFYLLGVNLCTR